MPIAGGFSAERKFTALHFALNDPFAETTSALREFTAAALPVVEHAMLETLAFGRTAETDGLQEMMRYHLGLDAEAQAVPGRGKRVRPLLTLLCCGAASPEPGGWRWAVPAAAAVELLHNFSLIHDDIQDGSETRRGRAAVWVRWGIAQAINAGDAMYTHAYRALLGLRDTAGPEIALQSQEVLQETSLALTRGQYLDLEFETRPQVSLEEYWAMIGGKTAALLGACTELGALAAGADRERRAAFRAFGRSLGLAFQAQDDLLGIWGDEARTGKSTATDLAAGKKSLPVLFGLAQNGEFARRWRSSPVGPEEAATLAQLLEAEGARGYTFEQVEGRTAEAMSALERADPSGRHGAMLVALAGSLIGRQA